MIKAMISDIKRFAVHDGPGIRTTVFFKGCPLKCVWCHNPECIEFRPQTAFYKDKCIGCGECENICLGGARRTYGREVSVEELLEEVLEDRDYYETGGGGVTLSGGECLCQADFCTEFLKRLKENGIHTAVDTCGMVSRETLDKVIPYTDLFLYDIKAMDEEVHIKCTGKSNKQILENAGYLDEMRRPMEIRIPYVPGYNADQMEKIADFLKNLHHITDIKVLPYHNYAGAKYRALGMENTLPAILPAGEEIAEAEKLFQR